MLRIKIDYTRRQIRNAGAEKLRFFRVYIRLYQIPRIISRHDLKRAAERKTGPNNKESRND